MKIYENMADYQKDVQEFTGVLLDFIREKSDVVHPAVIGSSIVRVMTAMYMSNNITPEQAKESFDLLAADYAENWKHMGNDGG